MYFMTTKTLSRRQAHWAQKQASYHFKILYRPGVSNPAYGPSRRPDYMEVDHEIDRSAAAFTAGLSRKRLTKNLTQVCSTTSWTRHRHRILLQAAVLATRTLPRDPPSPPYPNRIRRAFRHRKRHKSSTTTDSILSMRSLKETVGSLQALADYRRTRWSYGCSRYASFWV
jgi:hypothetical protein